MKFPATLFVFCALFAAHAQDADVFTKAPPDIDEALRARITTFYQAYINGKFKDAFPIVAEDAQDEFFAAPKDNYKSCEITKINYTDNFTKASAVVACRGEYRWRAERMPVTMPLSTTWKVVDGQWYWYVTQHGAKQTPFGLWSPGPESADSSKSLPGLPSDPAAAARDILNKVALDKTGVLLKGYETSQDEVHVVNQMPGRIRISVNSAGTTGLTIKLDKSEIEAGETTRILFSYSVEEAKAICNDCFKPVKPSIQADVRIEPTGQVFPIRVTFAIPPELQKQIPEEVRKLQEKSLKP